MLTHSRKDRYLPDNLAKAGALPIGEGGEAVWIDVIRKHLREAWG